MNFPPRILFTKIITLMTNSIENETFESLNSKFAEKQKNKRKHHVPSYKKHLKQH